MSGDRVRQAPRRARRIVVKVGSGFLTDDGNVRNTAFGQIARQVAKLVAGRRGYICDVCAAEAHRIMSEWDSAAPLPPAPPSIGARIRRLLSRLSNDGSSARALHRPA